MAQARLGNFMNKRQERLDLALAVLSVINKGNALPRRTLAEICEVNHNAIKHVEDRALNNFYRTFAEKYGADELREGMRLLASN